MIFVDRNGDPDPDQRVYWSQRDDPHSWAPAEHGERQRIDALVALARRTKLDLRPRSGEVPSPGGGQRSRHRRARSQRAMAAYLWQLPI